MLKSQRHAERGSFFKDWFNLKVSISKSFVFSLFMGLSIPVFAQNGNGVGPTQCKDILQQKVENQDKKAYVSRQDFKQYFVNEIRDHGIALTDYVDLFKNSEKVIYLTESHDDPAARLSLFDRMADLKKAGVTHLALECFTESTQKDIDFFLSNEGLVFLRPLRGYLADNWGYEPSTYVALVDAAAKNGIKVIALDTDKRSFIHNGGTVFLRDQFMAKRISEFAKTIPNFKAVVLIGYAHANRWDSSFKNQPEILAESFGIKSTVINTVNPEWPISPFGFSAQLSDILSASGMVSSGWFLPEFKHLVPHKVNFKDQAEEIEFKQKYSR